MNDETAVATRVPFGPFTLDVCSGELSKGATRLKVPDQSIAILKALLERPGQLVTRDELRQRLWPGNTFVDFEHGLNAAVKRLRDALGDSAENPRFIETLPKRGYRFVAAIDSTVVQRGVPPVLPQVVVRRQFSRRFFAGGALVLLLVAVGILAVWRRQRIEPETTGRAAASPIVTQITFEPGLQMNPTISPDGTFVAYASNQSGNFDIWVKPVDGSSPAFQVTSNPAHDWQPDWSPAGNQIVFRSERDGGGLYVVPAFRGSERQLVNFGYAPRWSPDGTRILFSRLVLAGASRGEVFVVDVNDRTTRAVDVSRLPQDQEPISEISEIGWHPDGKRITVYTTTVLGRSPVPHFVTIDVDHGTATQSAISPGVLDSFAKQRVSRADTIESLVWDPAGRSIYFIGWALGIHNLFAVDVDPVTLAIIGGPRRLTTTGDTNEGLSVSRDGHRIVTAAANRNARVSLYTLDSSGRRILRGEAVTDEKLFAFAPDLTRDGRKLLFLKRRFGSGTGRTELSERLLDLTGRDRLLLTNEGNLREQRFFPRWSPDGRLIAYRYIRQGPANTLIMSLILFNTATLKEDQLTAPISADPGNEVAYGWSPDQRFVVSATTRFTPSAMAIALFPVSAAPNAEKRAQIITSSARYFLWNTSMSPDGKWICFQAQKASVSRLAVVPANVGPTSSWTWLTGDDVWIDKPRWSADGRIIYYISRRGGTFNVWGLGFDSARGAAVGEPFQVTQFDGAIDQIPLDVRNVELGVSDHLLAFPVIHPTGGIWMLEQFKH